MRNTPLLTSSWISLCLLTTAPSQDPGFLAAEARHRAYDQHRQMTQASPYRNLRWQFLGPTNLSGRVTDLAVTEPRATTSTIYVATASGGVWKSSNEGTTWQPVFEHGLSTSIGAIALAPSDQDTIWVGTGEANVFRSSFAGGGVYKSTDGGASWTHMGLTNTHTIARIRIHPTNPQIVYVAASGHEWSDNEERGLYKTSDGGKTWTRIHHVDSRTGAIDLVMHPNDPETLYLATWQRIRWRWNDPRNTEDYDKSGVYKSTDAGKTWQPMNAGLPDAPHRGRIGIDLCRSQPDTLYAFVDNYDAHPVQLGGRDSYGRPRRKTIKGAEVYRSDDGAKSWRKVSPTNRFMARLSSTYGWVFGQIRVDPVDAETFYVMGIGLHVSRDGGDTYTTLRGMHGDHHALWINPVNPRYIINGNDGGANISYDGGKTWRLFVPQIPAVQFFNLQYDMAEPFRIYGSIQDHGSYRAVVDLRRGRRRIPAQDWERAPGGEGSHHAIDPLNPDIVYSCGFYGRIARTDMSKRRGRRFASTALLPKPAAGELPLRGQWLAPMIISHHDHKVIYHGMNRLLRSAEMGDDLQPISPDLSGNDPAQLGDIPYQTISALAEDPKQQGRLYVGTDDGLLHRTDDDGKTWQALDTGLGYRRWVSRIVSSAHEADVVYVAQNGKRHDDLRPYLWRSADRGQSFRSIAQGIPIGPINVVREDHQQKGLLFVGTDLGVYLSKDAGQSWESLSAGLPTTFVSDLVIHPRDDILLISTHGRGVYALDMRTLRRRL